MSFTEDKFEKLINDLVMAEEVKKIKEIQDSIRNPRVYYAVYNMVTGEVTYIKKKWYQRFNKKRIVHIIPARFRRP